MTREPPTCCCALPRRCRFGPAAKVAVQVAERAVEAHVGLGDDRALARARAVLGRTPAPHRPAHRCAGAADGGARGAARESRRRHHQRHRATGFAGDVRRHAPLPTGSPTRRSSWSPPSTLPSRVARRVDHPGDLSRLRRSPPRGGDVLPRGGPPGRRARTRARVGRWPASTWPTCSTSTIPSRPPSAARDAIDLAVRSGDVYVLGTGVANLVIALAATGDWDEADELINRNPNGHLVADDEFFITVRAWFAALRGEQRSPTSCSAK